MNPSQLSFLVQSHKVLINSIASVVPYFGILLSEHDRQGKTSNGCRKHWAAEGGSKEQLLGTRLLLTVSTCSLGLFIFGTGRCTKHLLDAFTIINQRSLMFYDKII